MSVEFGRVTSVIKASDVRMGPTRIVQAPPIHFVSLTPSILRQAETVASAAWERTGLNATDAIAEAESILSVARINSLPALNAADAVLEAQSILAQARTTPLTKEGAVAEAEYWLGISHQQPEVLPNEPFPVLKPAIKTVRKIVSPSAYFASSAVATDQQVEQKDKEAVEVRPLITEQGETSEDQLVKPKQVKEFRVSHTVDSKAVAERVDRIKKAAEKAQAEAESEGIYDQIEGWRIVKHIPSPQDKSLRGGELNEVDPKGDLPDGTWEANLANVAATSFTSVAAVVAQAPKIVAEDNPFIRGKGQGVTNENIATAYKHDPSKIHPAERVITRVISMQKRIEEPDIEEEGKIQEYPDLAEALLATQSNLLD